MIFHVSKKLSRVNTRGAKISIFHMILNKNSIYVLDTIHYNIIIKIEKKLYIYLCLIYGLIIIKIKLNLKLKLKSLNKN